MSQAERPRPQSKVREFIEGFTDQPGLSGSPSGAFTAVLVNQVAGAIFQGPKPDREMVGALQEAALTAMRGIAPADPLEGMLAAQMIAVHEAAMEAFRRAALAEQTFAGREAGLKYGAKLSRTYAALVDALDRHRGKGQPQVVRVERVTVEAGGRAIVGAVTQGGGAQNESEDRPHAQAALAHAPEPALRCPDPLRQPVPVADDEGQATLSDARRSCREWRAAR
jgi:hypothetical protein